MLLCMLWAYAMRQKEKSLGASLRGNGGTSHGCRMLRETSPRRAVTLALDPSDSPAEAVVRSPTR